MAVSFVLWRILVVVFVLFVALENCPAGAAEGRRRRNVPSKRWGVWWKATPEVVNP
jgi:hypothetical protein